MAETLPAAAVAPKPEAPKAAAEAKKLPIEAHLVERKKKDRELDPPARRAWLHHAARIVCGWAEIGQLLTPEEYEAGLDKAGGVAHGPHARNEKESK